MKLTRSAGGSGAPTELRGATHPQGAPWVILSLLFIGLIYLLFTVGTAIPKVGVVVLIVLNPLIILSWVHLGMTGGVILTGISAAASVLFAGLALESLSYMHMHVFLYMAAGIFCYLYLVRAAENTTRKEVVLQSRREDFNVLQSRCERARSVATALERRLSRYMMLRRVAQELARSLNLGVTLERVVEKAAEVVGKGDLALLFLADVVSQELALSASLELPAGVSGSHIKRKQGDAFDQWVLKQRQVLLVQDAARDFRFSGRESEPEERKVGSLIASPLVHEEKVVGVLRLEGSRAGEFITEDLRVLDIVAGLGAVAIRNAQLFEKTEELAIRDGLTGLYVHRHFQERFTEELQRAMRAQTQLSLVMLDIDHFKSYNDSYGHTTGDLVLRRVAGVLKSVFADGNVVARYGGEEFAVILPRVGREGAIEAAERLRTAIESQEILIRREQTHITVSGGVVTFPGDAMVKDELIRKADEALLRAKASGRNRILAA